MMTQMNRLRARRARHEGGFTLIELLVVIIILGVIAGVVVFAVRGVGDKGSSAALNADAKTMRTADEAYCAKNGQYAASQTDLVNAKLLSEGSTLHDVKRVSPGPCGNTAMIITCDPTKPANCADGSTPDGSLAGPTGVWTRTGDLPQGSAGSTLVTMSNGKVLSWGTQTTFPPTCPAPGDPACYGTVATQTYGNWAPGPISIYDPATATWSAAPALPSRPAWDPLRGAAMTSLTGSASECGANCGKVFVQASVGGPTTGNARLVAPDYRNNDFFLFDPAAQTWTTVNPPSSILTGQGTKVTQIRCGSRAAGSDCGKVMVAGYATDDNGAQSPQARDYDAPENQVAVFDPVDGSWATTSSPVRRIANTGPYNTTVGDFSGNGSIPLSTFTITDPGGGFRASDVGQSVYSLTVPPSGSSISNSLLTNATITAVSGCTGASCTTATMDKMSQNGGTNAFTAAQTNAIFIIGTDLGGSYEVLGASPGHAAGRVVIWSGGGSSVYDPATHAWSLTTGLNTAVPPTRTVSATGTNVLAANPQPPGTQTLAMRTVTATNNIFFSSDVGALVSDAGGFIPPGTRIAKFTSTKIVVLTAWPTNATKQAGPVTLTITPTSATLGQLPGYTCTGATDLNLLNLPQSQGYGHMLLAGGKVLSLYNANQCGAAPIPSNSLIFDPATNTWSATPTSCACVNAPPSALLLGSAAGGKPLMVYPADQGSIGAVPASALAAADGSAFTTITSTFTRRALNSDGTPRTGSAVTGLALLPNGQVLLAGGTKCADSGCTSTVAQPDTWLYTPPIP